MLETLTTKQVRDLRSCEGSRNSFIFSKRLILRDPQPRGLIRIGSQIVLGEVSGFKQEVALAGSQCL